ACTVPAMAAPPMIAEIADATAPREGRFCDCRSFTTTSQGCKKARKRFATVKDQTVFGNATPFVASCQQHFFRGFCLGATSPAVKRTFVRHAFALATVGVVAGLAVALAFGRSVCCSRP